MKHSLYPSKDYIEKFKDILHSLLLEKIKPGMKILDIGCGKVKDLFYISKGRDISSYGVDMELAGLRNALAECRKSTNIFLTQADAQELPYKNNMFDIIVSSEVIEHLHHADRFLDEIYRVLRSEGTLFITTPPRYNYITAIGKLVPKSIKKALRKIAYRGYPENDGTIVSADGKVLKAHVYEFLPGELKRILCRKGFKVNKILGGVLQIPVAVLFDRFPVLIRFWGIFDLLISKLPFSTYVKANFIMVCKKIEDECCN